MTPRSCFLAGLACLILAQTLVSTVLVGMRSKLVVNSDVYGALKPGEFAGTLMLGGFRGLACDLLWMRAGNAKDHDYFYESLALAKTITKVQPRFEQVWEYMGEDMAYNISHEIEDEDGSFAWVKKGIDIDVQGIERNPHSERLMRKLAFMLFNKGDHYRSRIEAIDWSKELNPIFVIANQNVMANPPPPLLAQPTTQSDGMPPDLLWTQRQVPMLKAATGTSLYQIAARLYQSSINTAIAHHLRVLPITVRMLPICMDRDGNRLRNQGEHLEALRRYIECLQAWKEVHADSFLPASYGNEPNDQLVTRSISEHNEGRVQRKANLLVDLLCTDPTLAAKVDADIADHRYEDALGLITGPHWRTITEHARAITWLDEH